MLDSTQGPARQVLAARDPQTFRERLDQNDLARLTGTGQPAAGTGAVVVDDRRRRPLYFDGRFLAARDLTREQNYFLVRQADLGRAGGAGVVHGLLVTPGANASSIHIGAGHGVTPAGEMVLVADDLELDLTAIADIQRLDAAFGLSPIPNQPARSRTGLFIVALRPVEYTANPITAYPTTITGPRSVEYGDIVEAAAITLIPYQDGGAGGELTLRRARAARDIFVLGSTRGIPAEALPLAMIALERGVVRWVDSFLVRREMGAQSGDVLGLGPAPRATREAYLLQYDEQLQDILAQRAAAGLGWRFAAAEQFTALPPAGRLPAAAINPDFTQVYFPPQVNVDLSIVPDDEVRGLISESLLLEPIDLAASADTLAATSVMILAPVPRFRMRALLPTLTGFVRPAPAAAPAVLAKTRPLDVLRQIALPPIRPPIVPPAPDQNPIDQAWHGAIGDVNLLWYVRRRNVSYRADLAGVVAPVRGPEIQNNRAISDRLGQLGLLDRFNAVRARATPEAVPAVAALLGSDKISASPVLAEAALSRLESAETLDSATTARVASDFQDPSFGQGIARLERSNPDIKDPATVKALLDSGALATVDKLGAAVQDEGKLKEISDKIVAVATGDDPDKDKKLAAASSVANVVGTSAVAGSAVLSQAALSRLENIDTLDAETADNVAETFSDPQLGAGIKRLESAHPGVADSQVVNALIDAGALNALDRVGATAESSQTLQSVAHEVVNLAKSDDPEKSSKIHSLVLGHLKTRPK